MVAPVAREERPDRAFPVEGRRACFAPRRRGPFVSRRGRRAVDAGRRTARIGRPRRREAARETRCDGAGAGRSRVFVALELGLAVRDLAEEAIAHLHAVLRDRAGLRFIRPPDLHVTLAFLGELEAPGLASLGELVAAVAREHAPPRCRGRRTGGVSRPEGAHVLWLGFGSRIRARPPRRGSAHASARRGSCARVPPLERSRHARALPIERGLDARAAFAGAPDRRVACRVEALVVMESRLRPDGSHYTPIFRALLSGGTQRERV
ncbi:MAG: hypothetical protein IPK00_10215 [Deltaproteobacteria bacterium]|nr:hypothetical protein [Deltaproteobacteria bacterium]